MRIPDTIHQPILVCSFIGYKNYYVPIGANSEEALTISMQRNVISLQEVIIRYKDPVTLLNETMSRIPENYLSEPSGVTAYYREKVTKDDRCMIFSEAVVEISKSAYSGNKSADRLRVLKARKISNIVLEDTVVMKIRSGANTTLQLDIIKNPPDFLSPDFMIAYNLSFSNVVMYKDRLVYVISFSQKEGISEPLFRGDLYIDRGSLAIIAADFEYDPVLLRQDPEMFVAKKSSRLKVVPLNASYHVEYAQLNNIYHLSQVQGNLNFKVRKRREWIASRYHVSIEMAVTDVRPGLPPEIRYNEQMKPSTILSDEEFSYDPEFWGDYTTITPEAKLEDALQNIEKSLLEISEQVISIPAPGLN